MKKILIVFDKELRLKMFVSLEKGVFVPETLTKDEKIRSENEKQVEELNSLAQKGSLPIIGYLPRGESGNSIAYKKEVSVKDSEFEEASRQFLTKNGYFAKWIPEEIKGFFLKIEGGNIPYESKKTIYSEIINTSAEEMIKISEAYSLAERTEEKIKKITPSK